MVVPKKASAAGAEARYQETLDGLRRKQAVLAGIMAEFQGLQKNLEDTRAHHQQLVEDIADCEKKLGRAQTLLEGLGGEQERWREAAKDLAEGQVALAGDCLLAAASIAYLGPYTSEYRASQGSKWHSMVHGNGILVSQDHSLQRLLGEPVQVRQWAL